MNVSTKWHKLMAVGCSHGIYEDPAAIQAALDFKRNYKPKHVLHLGDFCDTASLRSGAAGTEDESVPLDKDINKARQFLYKLEPTLVFIGNHEERIYKLLSHPKANTAYLAKKCVEDLRGMVKAVKADFIETADLWPRSWRMIGDTLFGHGVMYGNNALVDHVRTLRHKICMAHIHKPGHTNAPVTGNLSGYCVGMLADVYKLSYAHHRPATQSWNNGWVFGETNGKETVLWVVQKSATGEYRLPL